LFLAAKVEETPKKLKDVIDIMYSIKYKKEIKPDSPVRVLHGWLLIIE
jgi:hypothetical protein